MQRAEGAQKILNGNGWGRGRAAILSVLERTPCLDGLQKNSRRLSRNEVGAARCGQVCLQVWELSPCCSLCTMGVEVG